MKVTPFHCDCCPDRYKDLTLIETRFEGQRCFAELQCRVCHALWTAEIGPTPGNADPFASGIEDQPGWRVSASCRASQADGRDRAMPLSQQLREARRLLSWSVDQTSRRTGLPAGVIERAEIGNGAPDITLAQLARLRGVLEAAEGRIGCDGTLIMRQGQ